MNLQTLLEQWAAKYDAQTVLERSFGRGTAPACAALAAQGKTIVTVVDPGGSTERVRAAYGLKADVRVAGNDDAELPKSDLVLVHGTPPAGDRHAMLAELGKHATKLLVLVVDNPLAWPAQARSLFALLTGAGDGANGASARNGHADSNGEGAAREWGRTADLAPVLWQIGRVREHAFLDVPPLGLGPEALASRLAPRMAPRHAFVVDVTPRSPQARRRLRLGV